MSHGSPEYHSRGFETHQYVYSRIYSSQLPQTFVTRVLTMPTHFFKGTYQHPQQGLTAADGFYHGRSYSGKKSKGKEKAMAILDKEISAFCKSMEPSERADDEREKVVARIRQAVESCISPVQVEAFGSFKTRLYLPSSDIDIVVFHECQTTPFDVIREALVKSQVCDEDKILVLYNATVPIIKLTDRQTEIKVDIGFNIHNAPKSAVFIQKSLKEWPPMKELLMVLKQFLIENDLNEVYTGGISSYSLTLLLLSFFKIRQVDTSRQGSGELLLDFLRYYAFKFNYWISGISLTHIFEKPFPTDALVIQDPLCPSNDVARGSYRFSCVQGAFKGAFDNLQRCLQKYQNQSSRSSSSFSILESIIQVKPPTGFLGDHLPVSLLFSQTENNNMESTAFSSSSDDSATPSSSHIDFEECDVDRVATSLRDTILVSSNVTSKRPPENDGKAADDGNPSSSSSSSEIAAASDDDADCNSGSSDSGVSLDTKERRRLSDSSTPRRKSFSILRRLEEPVPDGADQHDRSENPESEADVVFDGRSSVTPAIVTANNRALRPSYRDVVRSTPSQLGQAPPLSGRDVPHESRRSDAKPHSCSEATPACVVSGGHHRLHNRTLRASVTVEGCKQKTGS